MYIFCKCLVYNLKRGDIMMLTIQEEGMRFGVRVGAIIYNQDRSKILLEKQNNKMYMFPGGRIDVHEDSQEAIERELHEELNIRVDLKLKYIVEMFLKSPKTKYHEIGFYFLTQFDELSISNHFKSLDGNSEFVWIPVHELDQYPILARPIKNKVMEHKIIDDSLEHIIYREYES